MGPKGQRKAAAPKPKAKPEAQAQPKKTPARGKKKQDDELPQLSAEQMAAYDKHWATMWQPKRTPDGNASRI